MCLSEKWFFFSRVRYFHSYKQNFRYPQIMGDVYSMLPVMVAEPVKAQWVSHLDIGAKRLRAHLLRIFRCCFSRRIRATCFCITVCLIITRHYDNNPGMSTRDFCDRVEFPHQRGHHRHTCKHEIVVICMVVRPKFGTLSVIHSFVTSWPKIDS